MRFVAVFLRLARESLREWQILSLALLFAPFFVVVFHVALGSSPADFHLALLDEDRRSAQAGRAGPEGGGIGAELARAIEELVPGEKGGRVRVSEVGDREAGLEELKRGGVDLLLVVPAGFAESLAGGRAPRLEFAGDAASPRYAIVFGFAYTVAEGLVSALTGREPVLEVLETQVRPPEKLEPFEAAVPSLVIISILTVMFTAAALFVREAEKGTLKRLRLSRLTALEYLAAATLNQLLVSVACVFLTFATALAFGYSLEAPLGSVLLLASLASLSVIAFGLITAGLCTTVKDVMIVGNFPYLFMLLFSGVMPLPSPTLFTLAGRPFGLGSAFPLSHGVKALDSMLNYGRSLGDLGYELGMMLAFTAAWLLLGLLLFRNRHLRT